MKKLILGMALVCSGSSLFGNDDKIVPSTFFTSDNAIHIVKNTPTVPVVLTALTYGFDALGMKKATIFTGLLTIGSIIAMDPIETEND